MRYQAGSTPLIEAANGEQAAQLYAQAQRGIEQQQAFINALQAQGGIANQSAVFQQQQDLANQLQQAAQGGGPNPALAQLQQTTGQNVANQAALMASQRGASANPAAIARAAAMQGGNIQQQAVGQAATLNAQQQIAARQQLQQQQGMMGGLATQQVGQLAGGIQGYNQAVQSEQQNILNAIQGINNARVGAMTSQNAANAAVARETAGMQKQILGGLGGAFMSGSTPSGGGGGGGSSFGGAGNSAGSSDIGAAAMAAHGGQITKYADGGPVSAVGRYLKGMTINAATGGAIHGESFAHQMKTIPGNAKIKGDSLKNDTVPAMLSPGEIIIPRSIAQSPDAPAKAAEFVAAVLAGNGPKPKKNQRLKNEV